MTLLTLDIVTEIDRFESHAMASGKEAELYLEYHKPAEDQQMVGHAALDRSILPTDGRSRVTQYEIGLTFRESPEDISPTIGENDSKIELRADYMGMRNESALFILRDKGSTDYDKRKGDLELYTDQILDHDSLDFLDMTQERIMTDRHSEDHPHEHEYPMGEPFDSFYVTLELEVSPGTLWENEDE